MVLSNAIVIIGGNGDYFFNFYLSGDLVGVNMGVGVGVSGIICVGFWSNASVIGGSYFSQFYISVDLVGVNMGVGVSVGVCGVI